MKKSEIIEKIKELEEKITAHKTVLIARGDEWLVKGNKKIFEEYEKQIREWEKELEDLKAQREKKTVEESTKNDEEMVATGEELDENKIKKERETSSDSEKENETNRERKKSSDLEKENETNNDNRNNKENMNENNKDNSKESNEEDLSTKQKLDRHWVEIMAETQTQTAGSITTYMHNLGKIKPLKARMALLAFPITVPLSALTKGLGLLGGEVIGKVNKKRDEMIGNLRKLSQKEFDILVNGLTETNMRQYKINDVYLEAVYQVLAERENEKKQQAIENCRVTKEALEVIQEDTKKLKKQLLQPNLTKEQKENIKLQLAQKQIVEYNLKLNYNYEYNKQVKSDKTLTDFERGRTGKSPSKMNIQGWFAGKFNPDNRELHKKMAEKYKKRREAYEKMDIDTTNQMDRELEELKHNNSNVVQLLEGTRFEDRMRISRGEHQVEEVHKKASDVDQTKARELIGVAMTAVAMGNLVSKFKQENVQEQVNNHLNNYNQNILKPVNDNNAKVQSQLDGLNDTINEKVSAVQGELNEQTLREAVNNEIHKNHALTYASGHEHEWLNQETPGKGFNFDGNDTLIHQAQEKLTATREAAEKSGSLDTLAQYYKQSAKRLEDTASSVLPDVETFTSIPGKEGFVNSEYVTNLQNLVNSTGDSTQLLLNVYKNLSNLGNIPDITGTIQQVPEISPLLLNIQTQNAFNVLPLVASIANLMEIEKRRIEQEHITDVSTQTQNKDDNNKSGNTRTDNSQYNPGKDIRTIAPTGNNYDR